MSLEAFASFLLKTCLRLFSFDLVHLLQLHGDVQLALGDGWAVEDVHRCLSCWKTFQRSQSCWRCSWSPPLKCNWWQESSKKDVTQVKSFLFLFWEFASPRLGRSFSLWPECSNILRASTGRSLELFLTWIFCFSMASLRLWRNVWEAISMLSCSDYLNL